MQVIPILIVQQLINSKRHPAYSATPPANKEIATQVFLTLIFLLSIEPWLNL